MARRRPSLRRYAAVAAAALGLAILAPSAAALVPIRTNTSIVLAEPGGTTVIFSGRLTTKLKKGSASEETRRAARKCLKGRAVVVESDFGEIARTSSDAKGRWTMSGAKPPGGSNPRVFVARDVRGKVLCGVLSKQFEV